MQAQDRDSITRLIVGGGPASGVFRDGATPVYTVGVERKPAGASVTFRLSMAYWQTERTYAHLPQSSRSVGVELVGIRGFGARRVRPYVLAGAGLYSRRNQGYGRSFIASDSGFVWGSPFPYDKHYLLPTYILGTGASVRIGAASLFGEFRLPLYYSNAFHWGPQSPLLFGIRF